MKAPCFTLASSVFLAGCQTLPVVPHAVSCDVSTELLSEQCASPGQISNNATYAALVDTMQTDRKALLDCGITAGTLREAIRRCNLATDEYNKKIDALNHSR